MTQRDYVYQVSEMTKTQESTMTKRDRLYPVSEMTIKYSSGYDVTRPHLLRVGEDVKLHINLLKHVGQDYKLPTCL